MTQDQAGSFYIHGASPSEQQRLTTLNAFMNESCLRELRLRGGERVLDVGSGLGQFSRAMARVVGSSGKVIGVERDPDQLREAIRQAERDGERPLVEFRPGDAYDPPLSTDEWGKFDVVHTRFLLEHIPDPLRVVRAMVRAGRPRAYGVC